MIKRNNKSIEEVLKVVAEKNNLEYVDPSNRKSSESIIFEDQDSQKLYQLNKNEFGDIDLVETSNRINFDDMMFTSAQLPYIVDFETNIDIPIYKIQKSKIQKGIIQKEKLLTSEGKIYYDSVDDAEEVIKSSNFINKDDE